ncbi:MAG: hypothetical protein M1831_001400 [Alyxoria varia]|nr:MAG: hypothetical protein M1831_001400 [Alyxoria varia]
MGLDRSTKLQSCLLLGLGFLPAGCAVGKLMTGNKITEDPSWVWVSTESFACWESGLGIVIASIPPLRQLMRLWYHNLTCKSRLVEKSDDRKPLERESQMALNKSPTRSDGGSNTDKKKKGGRFSLLRRGMPSAASAPRSDDDAALCDLEGQKGSISPEKSVEPVSEIKEKPESVGARFAARIDSKAGTGTLCNLSDLSRESKDGDDESLRIDRVLSQGQEQGQGDGEQQVPKKERQQTQDDRGRQIQNYQDDDDERWGISGEYNRRYGESLPIRLGSFGEYNQRYGESPVRSVRFNSFGSNGEYNEGKSGGFPAQRRGSSQSPQQAHHSPQDSQSLEKPELFSFYSSSEAGWMQMQSVHGDSARNSKFNTERSGQGEEGTEGPSLPKSHSKTRPVITITNSDGPDEDKVSQSPSGGERTTDERSSAFSSDVTPVTETPGIAL